MQTVANCDHLSLQDLYFTDSTISSNMRRQFDPASEPSKHSSLIPTEKIERAIYLIRGEKVMLDRDPAELYEVETRALNQAVGRNRKRFPHRFRV